MRLKLIPDYKNLYNIFALDIGKPINDEESMIENGPIKDKTSNDEN